ncbi:hypothetical protein GWI33_012427 [Rhynchophorus ferrugineus]|uniref:Peptidase S1 domain-containing protein n=1 Tax=Rhynchophorus ferrugineus TaxID=354439 RepID=A0A834I5J1_RHYFE|nr:hypothetical protein GWI33_012427 [Rhynchophorus ferrugineus]
MRSSLVISLVCSVLVNSLPVEDWSDLDYPNIYVEPQGDAPSESRIIGGSEATPNSHPYQVALFIQFPQGRSFCGGSIISENYILTAAHCMDK